MRGREGQVERRAEVSEAVPPPAQPAATGISDSPMIKITVPVTSGGKNLSSLANTGASSIMKMPEAITEP